MRVASQSYQDAADPAPDMRRQLLDVTARLLRDQSYAATTVRAIAEQVGIKAGSIYHHFPSKDAIVAAVVNEGVRTVHDAVTAGLATLSANATPRRRLETAIRAHLLSSLQNGDYVSASLRTFPHLPPDVRNACLEERRRYEAVWIDIVTQGKLARTVSPDAVRLLLLGALNWAGEWYRPGRLSIDQLAHDWAEIVLGKGSGRRD